LAAQTGTKEVVEFFLENGAILDFENMGSDYNLSLFIIFDYLWKKGASSNRAEILKLKDLALEIYGQGFNVNIAVDLLNRLQGMSFPGETTPIVSDDEMSQARAKHDVSYAVNPGEYLRLNSPKITYPDLMVAPAILQASASGSCSSKIAAIVESKSRKER
jgi:hypothetical protein